LALIWSFSSGDGVKFAQSSSQWEARPIPEVMSQTLPTNKKQGKCKETIVTVLNQRDSLTARNTLLHYKIIWASKKFKKWPRPLFMLKTDHAFPQKPDPSRETIPLKALFWGGGGPV
jgi:hypothetical protein